MAIAFENDTSMIVMNGGPVWTDSYTMPTVSNGIMFMLLEYFSGSRSSITYGGQSLTKLATVTAPGGSNTLEVWYLINPASGNNGTAASGTGVQNWNIIVYSGVNQVTPINASATPTQTAGTTFSPSVTSTVSNCWIVAGIGSSAGGGNQPVAGSGTTTRSVGFVSCDWFDSNSAKASGSNSLNVTETPSTNYGAIIIALAPSGSSSSNTAAELMMLM